MTHLLEILPLADTLQNALQPGRDIYGRALGPLLLRASAFSLKTAGASTLLCIALALVLPIFLVMRSRLSLVSFLQDFLLPWPGLALSFLMAIGTRPSQWSLVMSVTAGVLPALLRYSLARTQEVLAQDYSQLSRAMGASPGYLYFKHILPAVRDGLGVQIARTFMAALVGEATLNFFGLGPAAQAGTESLGTLLLQGKEYALEAPWVLALSSATLLSILFAVDFLTVIFFAPKGRGRNKSPAGAAV